MTDPLLRAPGGRSRVPALAWLGAAALAALAGATRAEVALHEYVAPDPVEDLRLGATSTDGAMAAAIQTQGGPVTAPDPSKGPRDSSAVYGAERNPPGSGGTYRIDGNTSRPDRVQYTDPFTPAVAPYKREFAFDGVDASFDLRVRDPSLSRLAVGGAPRPDDDQFYADLEVDIAPGEGVRIPTVGPSARLLSVRSAPAQELAFFHDGADDWFVRGEAPGRIRLVMHVALDRAVFGSPFAEVSWPRLWRLAPPVPEPVKTEGVTIARHIGVVDGTGPVEALAILVEYFRGFTPSDESPHGTGAELYRKLALSRKGVCRHRAYAFVVTALALGLPARFVRNEAHAWVEVSDGVRWHRIDLGGAAGEVDLSDTSRIAHVPPRDPFSWPPGSDSGQAMADRARRARPGPAGSAAAPSLASSAPSPDPAASARPPDGRPVATVTLHSTPSAVKRGARVAVSGTVRSAEGECAATRVDLVLVQRALPASERIPLGTLVTGDEGRYEGRVVVPYTVPPGDYEVRASTPGSFVCGEGQSR